MWNTILLAARKAAVQPEALLFQPFNQKLAFAPVGDLRFTEFRPVLG
jgi:hypothetical protein